MESTGNVPPPAEPENGSDQHPVAAHQPKKRAAKSKTAPSSSSGEVEKRVTRSRSAAKPAQEKKDAALAVKKTTALKRKAAPKKPATAKPAPKKAAAAKPAPKKAATAKPAPKTAAAKPSTKTAAAKPVPRKAADKTAPKKAAAAVKKPAERVHAVPEAHGEPVEAAGPSKKVMEPKPKRQKIAAMKPVTATVARPPEPSGLFVFGSNPFGALGLGEDETVKFRPAQVRMGLMILDPIELTLSLISQVPIKDGDEDSASEVHFVQVSCGGMHTVALGADGKVWTWGVNDEGALGRKTEGTCWEGEEDKGTASLPGLAELPAAAGEATQVINISIAASTLLNSHGRTSAPGGRC